MKSCRRISNLFGPYIYGDLEAEEMQDLRSHLELCSHCERILLEMKQAVDVLPRELPALSDEDRLRVIWAVKGAVKERERVSRACVKRLWAAGLAAVGLTAVIAGALIGFRARGNQLAAKKPSFYNPAAATKSSLPQRSAEQERTVEILSPSGTSPMSSEPAEVRIPLRRILDLTSTVSRRGKVEKRSHIDSSTSSGTDHAPGETVKQPDVGDAVAPDANGPDGAERIEQLPRE